MATSLGQLYATLGLDATAFDKGLFKAKQSIANTSQVLKSAGKQMSMSLTVPLLAAATAATKLASDFNSSMTRIETLVGLAGSQVEGMKGNVMTLSDQTGRSSNELAKALFAVTSAGQRGAEAMDILEASAKSSAIGLGDTKDIALAVTAAMNSYGKENLSAAQATNQLLAVVREGNLEASDLAPVIGRVIGMAATLGITFDEVGASIATFTRLGVKADEAVTGLRGIMSAFLNPTEQGAKALDKVGRTFKSLREEVKQKGLAQTLIDLMQAFEGDDEALSALIPNVRALAAVLGTAGRQGETYVQIQKSIAGATDLVDKGFERVSRGSGFQFKQALEQLKNVGIEMGSLLIPSVVKVVEAIKNGVRWFSDLETTTKKIIIAIGGVAAAVGPLLLIIGAVGSAIATLTLPVAGIIAGVVALTAAIVAASGAGGGGIAKVSKAFEDQKNIVDSLEGELPDLINTYNILTSKTALTKDEQEKLRSVTGKIAGLVPTAVSEWDKYGNALSINTGKAEEFLKAQKAMLGVLHAEEISNQEKELKKLEAQLEKTTTTLNRGTQFISDYTGGFGQMAQTARKAVPLTNEEVQKLNSTQLKLNDTILGTRQILGELTGDYEKYGAIVNEGVTEPNNKVSESFDKIKVKAKETFEEFSKRMNALQSAMDLQSFIDEKLTFTATTPGDSDILDALLPVDEFARRSSEIDNLMGQLGDASDGMAADFKEASNEISLMEQSLGELSKNAEVTADTLRSMVGGAIVDFAKVAGEALSGVAKGDVWNSILKIVADFAMKFGEALIAAGFASLAFQNLISNPILAIGAGIALVAAAAYASSVLNGGLGGSGEGVARMANGGIVPSGYPNDSYPALLTSGERVTPPGKLPTSENEEINIKGEFKLYGNDLLLSVERTKNKYR